MQKLSVVRKNGYFTDNTGVLGSLVRKKGVFTDKVCHLLRRMLSDHPEW